MVKKGNLGEHFRITTIKKFKTQEITSQTAEGSTQCGIRANLNICRSVQFQSTEFRGGANLVMGGKKGCTIKRKEKMQNRLNGTA